MNRSRLPLVILLAVLAAGLIYGFLSRPLPVDIVRISASPMRVSIEEEGRTRVRDRYLVSAPAAGYIRRLPVKPGALVRAGTRVAVLEPARPDPLDPRSQAQARARVDAARAAVASAEAAMAGARAETLLANQELERSRKLESRGFVSPQALDQAVQQHQGAIARESATRHAREIAVHELEVAQALLTRTARSLEPPLEIRSPIDGRVLRLAHESEGPVAAGQALLEIGDPQSLEIEVEVLSTSAVQIPPGTRVLIERWGGPQTLSGTVRMIEPSGFTKVSALGVEEQRVRVLVDLTSPPDDWDTLGDGYRVEARFLIWQNDSVLQVPVSALFRLNGGWAVFKVDQDRARIQSVDIGHRNGLHAQVLSGLSAEDRVISHPDDRITEGREIRPRFPEPGG